jgi:multiple antibiotic resistance protein
MLGLTHFNAVFVQVFVALSPLTVLPMFLSMTDGMTVPRMRSLSHRAVIAAFIVAFAIVLAGQAMFRFLGITVDDLRVAGGIVLLILSTHDLVFSREQRKKQEMSLDVGVVPLGIPLIVGPATMTTCLVLADTHGRTVVLLALLINLGLTGGMLHWAHIIKRFVRPGVSKAFGKVMSLFLAAIAVAMLRHGIAAFVQRMR